MWKYLRIAVTALSLLVCVLLIGLWVRSYTWVDSLHNEKEVEHSLQFASIYGRLSAYGSKFPSSDSWEWHSWRLSDGRFDKVRNQPMCAYQRDEFGGGVVFRKLTLPNWLLVIVFATIAPLPWLKWHFSLRTLLIVMTLLSLFFGAIAMSL